jgi:hypothetical protein
MTIPSFTQDGTTHEYLKPSGFKKPEEVLSWVYGQYPKVVAAVQLAGGGTVDVYGESTRWSPTHISVSRVDDNDQMCWAWILKAGVRRATESEWTLISTGAARTSTG